jgi:hypothetical protein
MGLSQREGILFYRLMTTKQLKECIQQKVRLIPQEMLLKVCEIFASRIEQCIEENGEHLEDTMFKTT